MSEWSMFDDAPEGIKAGWAIEEEDYDWIDRLPEGTPFSARAYKTPSKDIVKPSSWLRIENQNGFSSCRGHSLSSSSEICYWLASGGQVIQLSRWMAYVGTQIIDGINGDNGSTIMGGATLARTRGVCPESAYPYPSRYTRAITAAQYKAAEPYKMKTFRRMRTWADIRNWLDGGVGAVDIGVRWGNGGHAVCITETLPNGDGVKVANSWGTNWGDRGWFTWTRREMEKILKDSYTVAIGMTDMEVVQPREDWSMW